MSQHNFKEHNKNGCLWKRKSMCATSKNTIKMNVFEKEDQNDYEQRNVLLRLKTESVLTQWTNAESMICIVKIVFNSLRK